jgi:hypothetical protein
MNKSLSFDSESNEKKLRHAADGEAQFHSQLSSTNHQLPPYSGSVVDTLAKPFGAAAGKAAHVSNGVTD